MDPNKMTEILIGDEDSIFLKILHFNLNKHKRKTVSNREFFKNLDHKNHYKNITKENNLLKIMRRTESLK
jgi:hypothetical protein